MKVEMEVLPPCMPNYVRLGVAGLSEVPKIPVGELTEEQAEDFAQLMFNCFMDHWRTKARRG